MNKAEKEVYDQQMDILLIDKQDEYGNVSKEDWIIADKMARNLIITMKKSGIL